MNAIQKKVLIENECKYCINFVAKGTYPDYSKYKTQFIFGCHIEAVRNHYVSAYKDFQFCESLLDKISKEKGRTRT